MLDSIRRMFRNPSLKEMKNIQQDIKTEPRKEEGVETVDSKTLIKNIYYGLIDYIISLSYV
jgi:hypothetical protein